MKISKQQLQEAVKKTVEEDGLWDNIRKKKERGEKPAEFGDEDYPDKKGWDKAVKASQKESIGNINLFSLIDEIVFNETGEGIIDDLTFTDQRICEGTMSHEILEEVVNDALAEYYMMTEDTLNEAEYKGRKVSLGKISRGDSKKYKVHVKNGKGNVVKVEFGDPNMEIKRDNPKRRKSFRARHRCDNPGPRWKARYWSCRNWSKTPVSKLTK